MQNAQYMSMIVDGVEVRVLRSPDMTDAEFVKTFRMAMLAGPKSTTWVSGGETYSVVTPQRIGESDADWCARHAGLVAEAQGQLPPD